MSNELTNQQQTQLPAYMQDKEIVGVDALSRYVRPSRLKIVQKMSKAPFTNYNPGTLMVVPQMIVFTDCERGADAGQPFKFVPLFFYDEWIQTNPLGTDPFVRARSIDPRSELAQKAKNPDTWFETHPDDPEKQVANRECLNFVVMPYDHPLTGTPMVLTFSKANYKDGTNLSSMIKIRKASIFAQVFMANTAERTNQKGEWFGLDLNIPADTPWVSEEEYDLFNKVHNELKEVHESQGIAVDYADPADEDVTSSEF